MKGISQTDSAALYREKGDFSALGGISRWWMEIGILFRIQFSIIRNEWVWVFLMATVFPFTTLIFMKFYTPNPTDEMMTRMIASNMIFGLIVMGLNGMSQEISWQKHQGHFTFYASLPISKMNFVFANLLRGLMNSLPSFVIMAGIGQCIYGVQFHYSWTLLIVVFLALMSVVGFGVSLGFWSPNHQMMNMLSQALMMFVSCLSPVLVEMNQLPRVLQWVSYLLPTTYAADGLRDVLVGGWSTGVMIDCLVMLGFSLLSFVIITKMVDWRVKQ